jgi:hypothetical protein
MLNFAREKSLEDQISGKDLITFLRSSVGTYVGADGLIKTAATSEPRFDHDPVTGESLGLLIEEQRTNIAPYGNNMSQYGSYNMIKTANNAIAPDGTTTATKVEWAGLGGTNWYMDHIDYTLAAGAGTYTYSVWVKAPDDQPDDYYVCRIAILYSTGGNTEQIFPIGKTWRRISITKTYGASDPGYIRIHPIIFRNTPGNSDNGIGIVPSYVWVWGSQWEQGSFPTSYIPTSGSQITRQPDIASIAGTNFTDWYNATEGTIFTEFSAKTNTTGYPGVYWFNNNLTASRGFALVKETGPQTRVFQRGDDAVLKRVSFSENIPDSTFAKASVFYTNSEIGGSQNNEFQSPTSITSPYSVNRLYIGYHNSGGGVAPLHLNSHIKQLIYYPARISDIKLQQMTKVFS